jgi:hypothetical protein
MLSVPSSPRCAWRKLLPRLAALVLAVAALCCLVDAPLLRGFSLQVVSWMPGSPARVRAPPAMVLKKVLGKSRFGDDGTREKGIQIIDDEGLKKGWFSDWKWGTEVDVVATDESFRNKKKGVQAGDNSDRGLGGNQAYRNTESARLSDDSADIGQRIRKQRLAEYINSTEEAADTTFNKLLAGSFILVLLGLLIGVMMYYGIDGMIAIGNGRSG